MSLASYLPEIWMIAVGAVVLLFAVVIALALRLLKPAKRADKPYEPDQEWAHHDKDPRRDEYLERQKRS